VAEDDDETEAEDEELEEPEDIDEADLEDLDDEDLIAADAETPVGEPPNRRWIQLDGLARSVEHDEVVAQPLHLGEAKPAPHQGRAPSAPSKRITGISPLRANASAAPFLSVRVPLIA